MTQSNAFVGAMAMPWQTFPAWHASQIGSLDKPPHGVRQPHDLDGAGIEYFVLGLAAVDLAAIGADRIGCRPQMMRSVIAFSTARVRSRVPSFSSISLT